MASPRTGSQCLFWGGVGGGVESRGFQEGRRPGCFLLCSDALTCKGRGAPAPDLGFHVQNPVVRKCRGRRSLSALPADSKSLHSILYWPKRFWRKLWELWCFFVFFFGRLQELRTCRGQDQTGRDRVRTCDGDIGRRRLTEERLTSVHSAPRRRPLGREEKYHTT